MSSNLAKVILLPTAMGLQLNLENNIGLQLDPPGGACSGEVAGLASWRASARLSEALRWESDR